jgi:hypothetical protein
MEELDANCFSIAADPIVMAEAGAIESVNIAAPAKAATEHPANLRNSIIFPP